MAFAAKPTSCEINSGSQFATGLRAFVPLSEAIGPPREIVTNTIGYPTINNAGAANGARWCSWAAQHPEYQAGVFPYSTSADGAFRFWSNTPQISFGATSGYATGTAPTTRSMAVTFKVSGGVRGSDSRMGLCGMGAAWGDTQLFLTAVAGLYTGTAYKLQLARGSSTDAPTTDLVVLADNWYTAAIAIDDSGGAAAQKQCWYLYDWAKAATYRQELTGLTKTYNYSTSGSYFSINSATTNGFSSGLDGWLYAAILQGSAYWSAVDFAAYIADPIGVGRGTYTSGGTAVGAPQIGAWKRTTTTIDLGAARPSNGVGTVSYQWHRSATGNFTPGVGTAISGATTQQYTDTPPSLGPWHYKLVVTDTGANTATSWQVVDALDLTDATYFNLFGDSITDNSKDKCAVRINTFLRGKVRAPNHGCQGWLLNTHWQPNAYYVLVYGTPTGGTFKLSWGGVETSALPYNESAANVQTALQAIPAIGANVTVAGTLAAGMTVRFTANSTPWLYSSGPLTVSNNSLTTSDPQRTIGVICTSHLRQSVAKALADGSSLATVMLGANDAAGSYTTAQYRAALINFLRYTAAQGLKVLVHYPTVRTDNDSFGALCLTYNTEIDTAVATIADSTKAVVGDTYSVAMSARWMDNGSWPPVIGSSIGTLHPTIDGTQHMLEDAHAESILVALGAISYGSPSTVSSRIAKRWIPRRR